MVLPSTPHNSQETLCEGLVRSSGDTRVAFRVFRNQERRSISDQIREDPRKSRGSSKEVIQESKALFHILDDGDGTVTLKEFIDGNLVEFFGFGVNHGEVQIQSIFFQYRS